MSYQVRNRSRWWYLLPLLFSIFGGLISYFAIRHDDPSKARNCLIVGIALFVIPFVIPTIMIFSLSDTDFEYTEDMRFEYREEMFDEFLLFIPNNSELEISYSKQGGFAGIQQDVSIENGKIFVFEGNNEVLITAIDESDIQNIRKIIEESNYFELESNYPPIEGSADYFLYNLQIDIRGNKKIVAWTDTSENLPEVLPEISKAIEEVIQKYRLQSI